MIKVSPNLPPGKPCSVSDMIDVKLIRSALIIYLGPKLLKGSSGLTGCTPSSRGEINLPADTLQQAGFTIKLNHLSLI
jgi:hypothetical protein